MPANETHKKVRGNRLTSSGDPGLVTTIHLQPLVQVMVPGSRSAQQKSRENEPPPVPWPMVKKVVLAIYWISPHDVNVLEVL